MKKLSASLILVLFILLFLSACGKEEPAEENGWLAELKKTAVEAATENIFEVDTLIREVGVEFVIDKIYCGIFSEEALLCQEGVEEIFLECRMLDLPYYAGFDTRVGILLNADTLEVIACKEFSGSEVILRCLQTEKGQSRILCLHTAVGQGHRTPYFDLWTVQGGEWVELPTGIEELIPEEKRGDWGTEDCFLYMGGGDRIVVTYEEDEQIMFEKITYEGGSRIPSELTAILVWNPRQERFELATDTEQPAVGRD